MIPDRLRPYAKAVLGLLALIGTWGFTAIQEDGITGAEWFGLLIVIGGAGAILGVPNETVDQFGVRRRHVPDRGAVEPGSLALGLILGLVLAWVFLVR